MGVLSKRNYARSYYQTGMMYSKSKEGEYNPAVIINSCADGICFEADKALIPGFDICIKLLPIPRILNTVLKRIGFSLGKSNGAKRSKILHALESVFSSVK